MQLPWHKVEADYDADYELASIDDVHAELRRWKRSFWVLSAVFTLTLLAGVAELVTLEKIVKTGASSEKMGAAKGLLKSDKFFPDVPREKVVFRPNQSFVDEFPGTLREPTIWDRLIPDGSGFVSVPNPSTFGLSGGFPITDDPANTQKESYSISMFHQLHCLATIKSAFGPRDHGQHAHFGHCFDYLRQSIMCAGDTALEKAVTRDGVRKPEVDGWGVEHECKSWDTIWEFAYRHRVGDKPGIS